MKDNGPSGGACLDCKRRYGDEYGFPDLVVSDEIWEQINPGSNGAGLLCPSCLCARAYALGISAEAIFTSGPFAAAERKHHDAGAKAKRKRCCDRGLWYHEQTCKNWGQTY